MALPCWPLYCSGMSACKLWFINSWEGDVMIDLHKEKELSLYTIPKQRSPFAG